MADESNDERTEEATPERREEFREKGQVAVSREVTSVLVLAMSVVFLSFYMTYATSSLERFLTNQFQSASTSRINQENFLTYAGSVWFELLKIIIPLFLVTFFVATASTLLQTRFNWSWKRLQPDFSKMNPLKGLVRMVGGQALMELGKGTAKMFGVGIVAYLILRSEWKVVPGLLDVPVMVSWVHWADITQSLLWSVAALLVFVGAADYIYNFAQVEKKLKMTKQEIKEEFKRREVDPQVKAKIKRLQREYANRKMLDATKDATVVITNPTHYAVALKYEYGMGAPRVVAKGIDFLAMRIREVATENQIEIVENKPLARTLYKMVEIGDEIPESLYRAVSEIIRYVFHLKGIRRPSRTANV